MQLMHYIFWAKSNAFDKALIFSKSNANTFALNFGELVERSGPTHLFYAFCFDFIDECNVSKKS